MKVVSIGRRSSNEVVIRDPLVSREQHCLITEENGHYYIFDSNSKNGTYVNGFRIPNAVKTPLHRTDVVRIGNTVLPWQSYFKNKGHVDPSKPTPTPDPSPQEPRGATTTALQAIALVLSLVGMGCIGYVAVKVVRWSLWAFLSSNNTAIAYMGAGFSLVALILSEVADYQEESDDTTMAKAAEWISSTCLFIVITFIIYIYVQYR